MVVDELLPRLYDQYRISRDPDRHGIAGWSSGAIAAFTVAWERPDQFRKVLSGIGTFVNLAGGHVYPEKVRASDRKPLRIFMIDGRNDKRGLNVEGVYDLTRDWFYQNVRLKDALVEKGYDVNYSWGIGVHSHDGGAAMLPEMMRWLWRDHPVSVNPHDTSERSFRDAAK
jgi:enterochelin esterase family protein